MSRVPYGYKAVPDADFPAESLVDFIAGQVDSSARAPAPTATEISQLSQPLLPLQPLQPPQLCSPTAPQPSEGPATAPALQERLEPSPQPHPPPIPYPMKPEFDWKDAEWLISEWGDTGACMLTASLAWMQ